MIELTEDQMQTLESGGTIPPRVINPKTRETFVLLNEAEYERQNGNNSHNARKAGEWTDDKNERRGELVDKEIEGSISASEQAELEILQTEMLAYRRKVAPLQLDELRDIHRSL